MLVNPTAENVCGTIGTVFWTIQILPQIWKSWREKSTKGLSPWLMCIWAISGIFLGVYVIVQNINIPLILQPQLFTALAIVSWMQCLYYGNGRSKTFVIAGFMVSIALFVGLEMGLAVAIKKVTDAGGGAESSPILMFFGIFSAVLISVALIPQYIEIWQRREVMGLSVPFMVIDFAGAVFCMLSLLFKPKFDFIAAATYGAVMVQDGLVLLAAAILNPLARRRRQAQDIEQPTPNPEKSETAISSPISSKTGLDDEKLSPVDDSLASIPTLEQTEGAASDDAITVENVV